MGQCEVSFPAAAVRTGTSYLKAATATSNKGNINSNMALKRGLICGSSSSGGVGGGVGGGGTGTGGGGVGVFRSHHGPTAKHRTLNGNNSNFNLNTINTIDKSTLKSASNVNNSTNNNATLCSFAEGQQFTSRDLWLRMKSKGNLSLLYLFLFSFFLLFVLLSFALDIDFSFF